MNIQRRMAWTILLGFGSVLLICSKPGRTQSLPPMPVNPGFEQGQPGQTPPGWVVPPSVARSGWKAIVSSEQPKRGKTCAKLYRQTGMGAGFGNLLQTFDATPYRGKRVRLRASIRIAPTLPDDRAQMWLRVDKSDGQMGLFDNMDSRPVTKAKPGWKTCSIVGDVNRDAAQITIGVMLIGAGKVYLDDVSFMVLNKTGIDSTIPHPITERGFQNLTAFTRLLGYVRYFYPGDRAIHTDWNTFAVKGVSRVENASDEIELAHKLTDLFERIAPTIQVWPTASAKPALPAVLRPSANAKSVWVVSWKHTGYGLGNIKSAYNSERVRTPLPAGKGNLPAGQPDPKTLFEDEIGGVTCRVPLALYADEVGTLPHQKPVPSALDSDDDSPTALSANDRNVRLADVVLAWNVFQHFYPYFGDVQTDMGIIEAYKMAEIVGSTTAGTNGNIDPFTLPGGFEVVWTRMKVTKHDGSRHHGVGIAPTVSAAPTVQGVATGRDEVLEKAISVINCEAP